MKQKRIILTILIASFIGSGMKAQDIIHGTNLDIGDNNTLSIYGDNYHGNAMGTKHYVEGAHSLTVGYKDTITQTGYNSVAFGSVNKVAGNSSMAVGSDVKVLGGYSMGIGRHLIASKGHNMIIGNGITNPGIGPDVIMENHYSYSLMIGFYSSKPTLSVGPSPNTFGKVVNRTGKVAIGDVPVPDIAAKLHIRSDEGEDAGIYLQPHKYEKDRAFVRLFDENHELAVNGDGSMYLLSNNNIFTLKSRNANISNSEFTLGTPDDLKLNLIASDTPAFYSNAYRNGNACFRQTRGSSYAIEFKNDAMLFRTAVNQDPRGTIITNWRDPLCLKTNGNIVMNGKVGINRENTTANYTLAVDGGLLSMGRFNVISEDTIQIIAKDGVYSKPILLKGYVGINTDNIANGYALSVNGSIIAEKVMIKYHTEWPDYVFESDYKLMSMHDLRTFVTQNKHLPEVPSATEIENGLDVGQLQGILLKKIEELTLYTLQLQEQVERQQAEIEELKSKMR